jgi:hypothetical protein
VRQRFSLAQVPANAWAYFMGKPPEAAKRLPPLRVLPQDLVVYLAGSSDFTIHWRASFVQAQDATAFVANAEQLKKRGADFLKHPPVPMNAEDSDLLARTVDAVSVEAREQHVSANIHISNEARNALTRTVRNLPVNLLREALGFRDDILGGKPRGLVRKFGPSDKPLSQEGLKAEQGGWRVDAAQPRTVPLFEIADPGVEDCMLTYRARIKTANLKGRAYLEMWCRLPGSGEFFSKGLFKPASGTTDWASYQIPFYLQKGQRPDPIKLNLMVEGTGLVWIKDVELISGPLPAETSPPKDLGKPIKTFQPSDKPLTRDRVFPEAGGWRIDAGEKEVRTIHLFEVPVSGIGPCVLVYRLKMKTRLLGGHAYQEMWCRFSGQEEYFSKGFDHVAAGQTDWTTFMVPFRVGKAPPPEGVKLDLVVAGMGSVWIKDVELLEIPFATGL